MLLSFSLNFIYTIFDEVLELYVVFTMLHIISHMNTLSVYEVLLQRLSHNCIPDSI